MYRRVMKRACGFSVQTKWKVGELVRRYGISEDKIVYWPNGTDVECFAIDESREAAREAIGLDVRGPVALYVGQFFPWKGVATLVRALTYVPRELTLVLVGGTDEDKEVLLKEVPEAENARIRFVSFERRERIPHWLRAADVLVLPNTGRDKVSRFYTSPMKLFEYMAAGRPIVASDLPSIREILSEELASLVQPDDPEALARGIAEALENKAGASERAARARVEVARYSWDARARALLPHLRECALDHA
jgi:glycosyltransferase involved in cell wall biosynthesis